MLEYLNKTYEEFGIKMNKNETKNMVLGKAKKNS